MSALFERSFSAGSRTIGDGNPCFIIAEAGVSHFGSVQKAFALVDAAVQAKADAVKFQMFRTDALISRISGEWRERMRPKELPFEAFRDIQAYCTEKGILFFSTAHDIESLEKLERLDPPLYKIGSGEVRNPEFFRLTAERGKPVLFSTGMYTREDLDRSLDALVAGGCCRAAVMHCVTRYPVPPDAVNLRRIATLKELFPGPVGYSDHCATSDIAVSSVLLGAELIEKHITLEKNIPNAQDWKVACDPAELIGFVASIRRVEAARGTGSFVPSDGERESAAWARKSIVAARDLASGTVLTRECLAFKRPGTGMGPDEIDRVLGRRTTADIAADALITPDLLSNG